MSNSQPFDSQDSEKKQTHPSLRRYLLFWFAGCAILMVVAYTQLLEYYLELGIELRTESLLERTANEYAEATSNSATSDLPTGYSLSAYLDLADMPPQILAAFSNKKLRHGEVHRFVNVDFDGDGDKKVVDTQALCPEGNCQLLFLYSYRLNDDEWLYLLHGIVGSDEVYAELQFTERVAFAIGSLFAALLILVSFLVVRNIDRPLRMLDRWSANQNVEQSDPLPDLRFRDFDVLAHRLQNAFQRMREGVNKEKLFLRHASHELRTPIAILSSNLELLDRLTPKDARSAEQEASFVRQYRALDDVQLLIETLLWINRQSDNVPASTQININNELAAIVESYRYLLDTSSVSLSVQGDAVSLQAPSAAVRIVLSNLIRNAFQYTSEGTIVIKIEAKQISIENTASVASDDHSKHADEYGFGLGLELVSLICKRFDWLCSSREFAGGRLTIVRF